MPTKEKSGTIRRDGRDGGGNIGDFDTQAGRDATAAATKKLPGTGGLLGKAARAARARKRKLDSV